MGHCFQHIPLGNSLPPNNPHAVSVSLPKLEDVIGYEENNPETIIKLKNGYPRFFKNKLVFQLENYIRNHQSIKNDEILLPITSTKAKSVLENIFDEKFTSIEIENVCFLVLKENHPKLSEIKKMIQHFGAIISSRNAEKILIDKKLINEIFREERFETEEAEKEVKKNLGEAYQTAVENIFLTNSGTNAVFSAVETLTKIREKEGKKINVQLGWLYLDSIEIIKKRSPENYTFINLHQKEEIENWLKKNHEKVASIIGETISNPLLQCADIPWLHQLCKKYNIPLVLDNTMASPHCVDVLPYCDVVVESLTKFASGNGDVLMGAVIINENSSFKNLVKENIKEFILPPYKADCARLALEIKDYERKMKKISENTFQLYQYLKQQDFVEKIHSVYEENSWENFSKIRKNNNYIGLLSLVFKKNLAGCYDVLNIAKGPSLGTEFSLAMAYTYLAHYDLVRSEEGLKELEKNGLHPELFRISVGTEPIEAIIAEFEKLKN
jgi:cystathionine gamma-synthase